MFAQICSLRDGEKSLKQKLSDVEKMKSQLQNELSNRDRTIQQLRSVNTDVSVCLSSLENQMKVKEEYNNVFYFQSRSSDSKTEDHAHLYEKALKGTVRYSHVARAHFSFISYYGNIWLA